MLLRDPIRIRSGLRSASESDRLGISETDSHVRTDVRTDVDSLPDVNQETAVDADARIEEFVTIGQVIAAGQLWQTDRRHDVIRTGEREPIPNHVRAAVWYRDHGKCDNCPQEATHEGSLHLDHIIPWSAGGPDTTDNLRLLWEDHNLRRSNFIDFARAKMPATWWCLRCYHLDEHPWQYMTNGYVLCPIHSPRDWRGDGGRCRVARRYIAAAVAGEPLTWHQRPMFTGGDLIAYCAHCNLPGPTAVVL